MKLKFIIEKKNSQYFLCLEVQSLHDNYSAFLKNYIFSLTLMYNFPYLMYKMYLLFSDLSTLDCGIEEGIQISL